MWHLDEMVARIGGKRMFLWRAVDGEGEVLDMLVQKRRNKAAAVKLLRKLLRGQGTRPEAIVTDGLGSYRSALSALGLARRHRPGRLRANNRAENSHLPLRKREHVVQRFKSQGSAQLFASTHAAFYDAFNVQRHPLSRGSFRRRRAQAMTVWAAATA
jgi:transposase-like protein